MVLNSNTKKECWDKMSSSERTEKVLENLFKNSRVTEKPRGIEIVPFRRELIPDIIKWNCLYGIPGYK